MNRKTVQLLLWPVIIILAWLVYRSPISLKDFQEEANFRKSAVIQDLKDIRTAQIAFKDKYRVYAGDFNSLLSFVKNDSLKKRVSKNNASRSYQPSRWNDSMHSPFDLAASQTQKVLVML